MRLVTYLGWTFLVGSAVGLLMAYLGLRTWLAVLGAACVVGSAMGWAAVSSAVFFNRQGEFVNDVTGAVN